MNPGIPAVTIHHVKMEAVYVSHALIQKRDPEGRSSVLKFLDRSGDGRSSHTPFHKLDRLSGLDPIIFIE